MLILVRRNQEPNQIHQSQAIIWGTYRSCSHAGSLILHSPTHTVISLDQGSFSHLSGRGETLIKYWKPAEPWVFLRIFVLMSYCFVMNISLWWLHVRSCGMRKLTRRWAFLYLQEGFMKHFKTLQWSTTRFYYDREVMSIRLGYMW